MGRLAQTLGVMNPTVSLLRSKFPEPEFTRLQRKVFASVQAESHSLASVMAAEQDLGATPSAEQPEHSPMVRFGAYLGENLIGWSCGWFERGDTYYMAHSGVLAEHRREGIYSALLDNAIEYAKSRGAIVVRSQHSVLNNAVIICKLKRNFHITGLSVSAQMGNLVELSLHMSLARDELFLSRVIPFVAPQ